MQLSKNIQNVLLLHDISVHWNSCFEYTENELSNYDKPSTGLNIFVPASLDLYQPRNEWRIFINSSKGT